MTCYDIYIIFIPPDPTSLACGSNVYGSTIIMMSPPPAGFLPGNCKVSKATVCTEIPDPTPQPPTGKYTPPGEDPVDLEFEEKETDDGDPYYEAPLPDTEGEDYEFDIDIPLEEGEDPETIPLNFTHGGFRLSSVLGEVFIYASTESTETIVQVNDSGETVGTFGIAASAIATYGGKLFFSTSNGYLATLVDGAVVIISTELNDNPTILNNGDICTYDNGGELQVPQVVRCYDSDTLALKSSKTITHIFEDYDWFWHWWDSDGNFYITSNEWSGYHGLAILAKYSSGFTKKWRVVFEDWFYDDTSKETISDMSFDEDGNVYVITINERQVDYEDIIRGKRLIKLNSQGVSQWEKVNNDRIYDDAYPQIAVSNQGFIVCRFNSQTSVTAFSSSGDPIWETTGFSEEVTAIFTGEDGYIYVQDYAGLHKLGLTGDILWTNTDAAYTEESELM